MNVFTKEIERYERLRKDRREKKRTYHNLNVWIIILFSVIGVITIASCLGQAKQGTKPIKPSATPQAEQKENQTKTVLIEEIDLKNQQITFRELETKDKLVLFYQGGTNILNRFQKQISITQLTLGEIVTITYTKQGNQLSTIAIEEDYWEYKEVGNYTINYEQKFIQIGEDRYQFDENLFIAGTEKQLTLLDINRKDELTIRGKEGKVYSVLVTKGHGYIKLHNYADLVGGSIEVGYGIITPITEDMLIVAREGKYKVTFENGELTGTKHVIVKKDEETVLDLSDYKISKDRIGTIQFQINPKGASLFLNGTEHKYEKPIELNYGKHKVEVRLEGYESYVGELTVAEPSQVIEVELVDNVKNEEDTEKDESEEDEEEKEEEDSSKDESVTEEGKVIEVTSPKGAEVYWDGTYQGVAPVKFKKVTGTHTISLRQSGHETKSYTVEVVKDGEDATFSFPDMVKVE